MAKNNTAAELPFPVAGLAVVPLTNPRPPFTVAEPAGVPLYHPFP